MNEILIKKVAEHYEVYLNNKFIFSADTMEEITKELEENKDAVEICSSRQVQ